MEMNFQGWIGVGTGVYRPSFIMVGLVVAQAVHDLTWCGGCHSVTPEDISDISKVMSQEGKKVLQNMQKRN